MRRWRLEHMQVFWPSQATREEGMLEGVVMRGAREGIRCTPLAYPQSDVADSRE